MGHLGDKLTLIEGVGGDNEQENREAMLEEARRRGATHILTLDGDEVYADDVLSFTRRLLEVHEHLPALNDPAPTAGVLVNNIGMRPICPGFLGPDNLRPSDDISSATEHSVRVTSTQNLRGNGPEWGAHGFFEAGDHHIQPSPQTQSPQAQSSLRRTCSALAIQRREQAFRRNAVFRGDVRD